MECMCCGRCHKRGLCLSLSQLIGKLSILLQDASSEPFNFWISCTRKLHCKRLGHLKMCSGIADKLQVMAAKLLAYQDEFCSTVKVKTKMP